MRQFSIALIVAVTVLLLVAGQALAYRLVLVPCGDLLPEGMTKLEYAPAWNLRHDDVGLPDTDLFTYYRVDTGLPANTELQVAVIDVTGQDSNTYVSGQWMFLQEPKAGANVSLGVLNLGNDNDFGGRPLRSFYVAATRGVPMPWLVKRTPRLTLGAGTDQVQGVWGGAVIPVSPFAQFCAEYTPKLLRTPGAGGVTIAWGYDWSPHFRTKVASLGGDVALGVVYTDWFHK